VKKLLWLDLEMSGLDVDACRILEVAAIVTDMKFNELDSYEAIVFQPPEVLEAMDAWCTRQHGLSGLTEAVATGKPEGEVEDAMHDLIKRHWGRKELAVLAGNSIGTDRDFIKAWWPKVAKRVNYRLLDVSSFKLVFRGRYGVDFKKGNNHRALDDIRESMAELTHYLGYLDAEKLPVA
jgi:oligoribonuclease